LKKSVFRFFLSFVKTMTSKYENDKTWENITKWSAELGIKSWSSSVVCMYTIHPRLFMGSRLSAQTIIDKGVFKDQDGVAHEAKAFRSVCVASERTCAYCESSSKYQHFEVHDRQHTDEDFLETVITCCKKMHKMLRRGNLVLVHCHSGRNRSALAVLVYCAMYTDMSYEDALFQVRKLNSTRFSMQSTLQNSSFTSFVRANWQQLSDCESK